MVVIQSNEFLYLNLSLASNLQFNSTDHPSLVKTFLPWLPVITALFLVGTFFCDLSVSHLDSSVLSSCLTLWTFPPGWERETGYSVPCCLSQRKHLSWFMKLSLLPSLYLCRCPLLELWYSLPWAISLAALPSSKLNLFLQNHGLLLEYWHSFGLLGMALFTVKI